MQMILIPPTCKVPQSSCLREVISPQVLCLPQPQPLLSMKVIITRSDSAPSYQLSLHPAYLCIWAAHVDRS